MKTRKIVWEHDATMQLIGLLNYITSFSPKGSEKVRDGIINCTEKLIDNPEKYPIDRFKRNNNGNYRAFEIYNYRIAYKITEDAILILRIRHVKQEPDKF